MARDEVGLGERIVSLPGVCKTAGSLGGGCTGWWAARSPGGRLRCTHGLWILLDDEELVLPFEQFPWFRSANIAQIAPVERPAPGHLYWPALDVDLSVASIRDPGGFPLIARG